MAEPPRGQRRGRLGRGPAGSAPVPRPRHGHGNGGGRRCGPPSCCRPPQAVPRPQAAKPGLEPERHGSCEKYAQLKFLNVNRSLTSKLRRVSEVPARWMGRDADGCSIQPVRAMLTKKSSAVCSGKERQSGNLYTSAN